MTSAVPINAPPHGAPEAPPNNSIPPQSQSQRQQQQPAPPAVAAAILAPPPQQQQQQHHHQQQQQQNFAPPLPAPVSTAQNAQNASPPSRMDLKSWWKGFQLKKAPHQDNNQQQGQGSDPLLDFPPSPNQRAMSIFHEDVERPAKPSRLRRLLGRSQQAQQEQSSILASARSAGGAGGGGAPPAGNNACNNTNKTSPPSKFAHLFGSSQSSLKRNENQDQQAENATDTPHRGIFGVPLHESIRYANVAISLVDENGDSYIYGYVPIVVAKCGVYLKEKGAYEAKPFYRPIVAATGVEGIFRLSGSEKRIKELKTIFDSPDRYGKGLVWDGYTVHDAANVFRRYLNDLPEPVVPLELYERFREPLQGATKRTMNDGDGPQFIEDFDLGGVIHKYQNLIMELPPLNRQLLLYILDLLAVFAAKADENRMTSQNLAAVFSPGIISHPNHAMAPEEYRLNQCVLIFLIENQDHFLIGMTAPPGTETAAITADTQPSTTETATSASDAATPPVEANLTPTTMPTAALSNAAAPQSFPTIPEKSNPGAGPAEGSASVGSEADGAGSPDASTQLMTTSNASIPIITTPPESETPKAQEPTANHDDPLSSPSSTNGLSRSKSVPNSGRKKLQKPRPVGGNTSAQSSQISLGAPKS
ncbi:Rho-GTPase-activating protein 5 like [Zalerion maritima]|uniref:Rho-GTPase-activating protein 5 like n=1 Tax=Zalerion maritima TaxID=339359 RepID=A0AAD5WMV1_9PEZI|nr:Rho-GTPase-activating protein 5 like [Zalerion maritima]